jgi:putative ABC transport system substrate-binding protein
MNIPQDQQLKTFTAALPKVKTIGIVYDPKRTGRLVAQAAAAAKNLGIVLKSRPVNTAREVAPALEQMRPSVEAVWMLPDLTVINEVTTEYMLSFSLSNRIPLLTFSDKYVEQGALMSVSIDTTDIGIQAGEMATLLLSGTPVHDVPAQEARKAVPFINLKVAKKLNITIDRGIIDSAVIID